MQSDLRRAFDDFASAAWALLEAWQRSQPRQEPVKDAPAPLPLLVDRRQAAELLSCSPSTIDSMRASGELPVVMLGTAPRFAVADLQAWIERNKSSAPSHSPGASPAVAGTSSTPAAASFDRGAA